MKARFSILLFLSIFLLLSTASTVLATKSNWLPLPPAAGPDLDGANSWFPALDLRCNSVIIEMNPPTTWFGHEQAGVQAVEWRFVGLYNINDVEIPTALSSTNDPTPGDDPRSIGLWREAEVSVPYQTTFSITTPLAPGTRAYGVFQNRTQSFGDPQNPPPFGNWSALIQVGAEMSSIDFMARASHPDYSVGSSELSCDPNLNLNTAQGVPTLSLDANGNPASHIEGNSGHTDFVYKANLSAPSSNTIMAHVIVGSDQVFSRTISDSGYPLPSVDNTEGDDHVLFNGSMVLVANTLTYRTEYPFGCNSGTTYCNLGIDDMPEYVHELVFAPGETSKTFTVRVFGDTVLEEDLATRIEIQDVSNAKIGSPGSLTLTTIDDDEPTVSAAQYEYIIDECGQTPGTSVVTQIPMSLNFPVSYNIGFSSVIYPAMGATEDVDFIPLYPTGGPPPVRFSFTPGSTTTNSNPVTIYIDAASEPLETVGFDIITAYTDTCDVAPGRTECFGYAPLPGLIAAPGEVTFTILPNGPDGNVLDASAVLEGDGNVATFTVTLAALAKDHNNANRDVSFDWQTVDGTAIGGEDYVISSGTVTIPAGQLSAQFSVPLIGDNLIEGSESFSVEIIDNTGSCMQDSSASVTINDDDTPYPANLLVTGEGSVAPLSLELSWDHNDFAAPLPASDSYTLTVYRPDESTLLQTTLNPAQDCPNGTCSYQIFDDLPYEISDGTYDWTVSRNVDGQIYDTDPAQFIVNIGAPQAQTPEVDVIAGKATLYWLNDPAATWYRVQLLNPQAQQIYSKWLKRDSLVCPESYCAHTADPVLPSGTGYQAILTSYGPFNAFPPNPALTIGEPAIFDVIAAGELTGMEVINAFYGQPDFAWAADSQATWYHFVLQRSSGTPATIWDKWYPASSLNAPESSSCTGGEFCQLDLNLNLLNGDYVWTVQTWGPSGWNNNDPNFFSSGPGFNVNVNAPAVPVVNVLDPNSGEPGFQWSWDSASTWYRVRTFNTLGQVTKTVWYRYETICEGVCVVESGLYLKNDTGYKVDVTGWGPGGFGQAGETVYDVSAPAIGVPAPTSPEDGGTVGSTPVFGWPAVDGATWYQLQVYQGNSLIYNKWLRADDAFCWTTPGEPCSTSPLSGLFSATYYWNLRAYSPAGMGAWGSWRSFTIVP